MREWPYKNLKPRVIAEQYMEDETGELRDYKFFCFDGRVEAMFIASDRNKLGEDVKFYYFDRDFNRLPMRLGVYVNSTYTFSKLQNWNEMINIAEKLCKGIPQVKIDLYNIAGWIYFGKYTIFHHGGFVPFIPNAYDTIRVRK